MRAENRIYSSDRQSCSADAPPVMITDHVPAVRVPADHATSRVAEAVPARGDMADRRDLDPAPPARRPAAAAAAPREAELGGPGTTRGAARRDTESPPPRIAAAGHPGHDPALAPRHRPAPPGGAVRARQDRPPGDPPEHQGPGPPTGPGEPRLGLPPDPRRDGRPGSQGRGVNGMGESSRPAASAPPGDEPARPGHSSCVLRPRRSWHATSSPSTCPTAARPTSWP